MTANTISNVNDPAASARSANRRISSRGAFVPQLPHDEAGQRHRTDDERGQRQAVGPAPLGTLVDAEHEAADRDRREQRADRVEPAQTCSSRELPTTRSVSTSETPANRTGIANSHGHVK